MSNIMIDLETMGTSGEAAIVSIGLVRFNNKEILDLMYMNIDLKSSMEYGGIVEADTVMWWLDQSPNARAELIKEPRYGIFDSLINISSFINNDDLVWGNGSDFDNVILSSMYRNCDIQLPWKHYNNRCYRTMKNLAKNIKMDRIGIHHSAIDDAKSQAIHLIKICNHLGIKL